MTLVASIGAGSRPRARISRWIAPLVGATSLAALALVLRMTDGFPTNWNMNLNDPVDDFQSWIIDNKATHPLWQYFFTPVSDVIEYVFDRLADEFLLLPWYALPVVVFAVIARTRQWATAVIAALLMTFPGTVGLWEPTMETLALLVVAVSICVVVGVPLGVLAALSERFHSVLRPVLDAMQTVPSTVYLVPSILFFSIGKVPAAVSLVLFALPPVVRLTTLGIRDVPPATVDAGRIFGSSRRQLLTKVQLPQALPSIMTGINQTINLGIGIVVIAALIGAGGLGQEALDSLRQRAPGRGLVVGAALVALAIVLDRLSRSFVEPHRGESDARRRWAVPAGVAGLVAVVLAGRAGGWTQFPVDWGAKWADPFDDFLTWVRDTFREQITWLNDHFVRDVYLRVADWLTATPWPVIVMAVALIGAWAKGWRLATFFGASALIIGLTGFWNQTLQTTVQVLLASTIAMAIALPLGVWAGRRTNVEKVMLPVLDAFQTVPSLLYAVIFVYLIDVSMVPGGILASVLYAIAPGIRVTALGIKQVPESAVEAATAFGATNRQLLYGIRMPLAISALLVALNQVVLITVSMVIIAGLTGGGALGYEIVDAFTGNHVGKGFEVAIALALMAMMLDRLTQAVAQRYRPPVATH
ncbi:MAG: ABC transporter permease subunit [Ilumatobacteraceae bacterium]